MRLADFLQTKQQFPERVYAAVQGVDQEGVPANVISYFRVFPGETARRVFVKLYPEYEYTRSIRLIECFFADAVMAQGSIGFIGRQPC